LQKIIIFVESIFNKRDYHRYGLDIIIDNGFHVEVWDYSPLLRPKYFNNYSPPDPVNFKGYYLINNKDDAEKMLLKLSSYDTVVWSLSMNASTVFILTYLLNNDVQYGVIRLGALPQLQIPIARKFLIMIKRKIKTLIQSPYKTQIIPSKIYPPSFLIIGGSSYHNTTKYGIVEQTKLINAHALDYDRFLEEKHNDRDAYDYLGEYIVFLDEYAPYHPDVITRKKPDTMREIYFITLNKFFDYLEEQLKMKVIIAAHPRSNYKSIGNPFNERVILFGQTVSLVKSSKCVLAHSSTSLNFANLYRKPVIFLTHYSYSRIFRYWIVTIASAFGKKPIELSEEFPLKLERELIVNNEKYDSYKEKYIKETGTPETPIWEIFADYLKESKFSRDK